LHKRKRSVKGTGKKKDLSAIETDAKTDTNKELLTSKLVSEH